MSMTIAKNNNKPPSVNAIGTPKSTGNITPLIVSGVIAIITKQNNARTTKSRLIIFSP